MTNDNAEAPEPEEKPDQAPEPAEAEPPFNKSTEVRRLIKAHSDWSFRKIQNYFETKHGTTITKSTISRAKQSNGRI